MGWIGVDLDGTLAKQEHSDDPFSVGEPIAEMVDLVKKYLASGEEVRIFTARVAASGKNFGPTSWCPEGYIDDKDNADKQRASVAAWSEKVFGVVLPVTAKKDMWMTSFYDDRAVQVTTDTGKLTLQALTDSLSEAARKIEALEASVMELQKYKFMYEGLCN